MKNSKGILTGIIAILAIVVYFICCIVSQSVSFLSVIYYLIPVIVAVYAFAFLKKKELTFIISIAYAALAILCVDDLIVFANGVAIYFSNVLLILDGYSEYFSLIYLFLNLLKLVISLVMIIFVIITAISYLKKPNKILALLASGAGIICALLNIVNSTVVGYDIYRNFRDTIINVAFAVLYNAPWVLILVSLATLVIEFNSVPKQAPYPSYNTYQQY